MELRPDFSGKSGLELAASDDCVIGADAVAEKCCGAMGGFKPTPIEEECETLVILPNSMHMAGIMATSWHLHKDDRHKSCRRQFHFFIQLACELHAFTSRPCGPNKKVLLSAVPSHCWIMR